MSLKHQVSSLRAIQLIIFMNLLIFFILFGAGYARAEGEQSFKTRSHSLSVRNLSPNNHEIIMDGRSLLKDNESQTLTLLGPFEDKKRSYFIIHTSSDSNACPDRFKAVELSEPTIWISPVFTNCNRYAKALIIDGILHITLASSPSSNTNTAETIDSNYTFGDGRLTTVRHQTQNNLESQNSGLHVDVPSKNIRLYYKGPNEIGPTILDRNVAKIIIWPPNIVSLKDSSVRGVRLGMTAQEMGNVERENHMQQDDVHGTNDQDIWYEGLGPRAPAFNGMPNALRLNCGPDALSQFGMLSTMKRQTYQTCVAFRSSSSKAGQPDWVSSVQILDSRSTPDTTLRALVEKYGPPSVQTASNEMIWFAKYEAGTIFAIDALFSDIQASADPDSASEGNSPTSGPKLLDIEMKYFAMPVASAPVQPAPPKL